MGKEEVDRLDNQARWRAIQNVVEGKLAEHLKPILEYEGDLKAFIEVSPRLDQIPSQENRKLANIISGFGRNIPHCRQVETLSQRECSPLRQLRPQLHTEKSKRRSRNPKLSSLSSPIVPTRSSSSAIILIKVRIRTERVSHPPFGLVAHMVESLS